MFVERDTMVGPVLERPSQQLIEELLTGHTAALRLLRLLVGRIEPLSILSEDDLTIARDVLSYMVDYIDRYHHPREDVICVKVEARHPDLAPQLREFDFAHEELRAKGSALLEVLSPSNGGKHTPGQDIGAHLAAYSEELAEHFDAEEQELFPVALEALSQSDCDVIEAQIARIEDPVFGPHPSAAYEALFQHHLRQVYEIGSPSKGLAPTAVAVMVDSTGAIIGGIREAVSAAREGVRNSIRLCVSGAAQVVRSRGLRSTASAARGGATTAREQAVATFARMREAARRARRSTLDSAAYCGSARQFHARRRIDPTPPSWQAQIANVALRATVKRMMSTGDVESMRGSAPAVERLVPALPRDVMVRRIELEDCYAEMFEIKGVEADRTILHLPGGGFLFPATQIHRLLMARIARATGARVMLVHYRLAPEHPFPCALHDALAAYRHLLAEGVDSAKIALMGDSAGGGLVLSTLLSLRDAGEAQPRCAVLVSPLADLTNSGESRNDNCWRDPMLPLDRKNNLAELYLRDVSTDDPLVSPIFADYHRLPPLLVQVGSTEILLDDALRVATRARSGGVDCVVEVWHEMPHDWMLISALPESVKALQRIAAFLDLNMGMLEPANRKRLRAA